MILLTATTETLELQTDSALSTDWSTAYADITTSVFTPGSNQGNVATATTTTIVAAPAASTQRQVKLITVRNRHATSTQTITIKKDVSATEYHITPPVTLLAGESFTYVDGQGYSVMNASGQLKGHEYQHVPTGYLHTSPVLASANTTTAKTITTTETFALYMGRAPRPLSSIQMRWRVTTAAATITWAEIALAKGIPVVAGNPSLTVVGYADVSAVINSTGLKSTTINVSSGQSMNEGDDLWLLIGNQATTAALVRAQSVPDDLTAGFQAALATRPSLNVGSAQTYTLEASTVVAAWLVIVY